MTEAKPRTYQVLSLFSGGMGLDLGMHATGRFRTIACIEKVPAFCETIRTNQAAGHLDPELRVLEADISRIEPAKALKELGIDPSSIDVI